MFCSLHANTAIRGGGFLFSPAFKTKFYWPVSFVGKVVFRNSGKGGKEGGKFVVSELRFLAAHVPRFPIPVIKTQGLIVL